MSALYLDNRRGQILDAAAACFARHGFHATTMQQICAEAGLSPGAIYRYFPAKEEIIATLCEREFERSAALIAAAQQHDRFDDAIGALLSAFFGEFDKLHLGEGVLAIEMWAEASRNGTLRELGRNVIARLREPLAAIARRAQARGELNPALDPDAVAVVGMAHFYGLLLQKVMDPALDVAAFARVLRALLDGTFRPQAREDGA